MSHIQIDINALISSDTTKISEIRAAIKLLRKQALISPQVKSDLSTLFEAERHLRRLYKTKQVNFVEVGNGRFGVSGRPSIEGIKQLADSGADVFITLLKETETNCRLIGEAVVENQMEWVWFPLSATQLPSDKESLEKTVSLFKKLKSDLNSGKTIYVHCAAGVHRTGSFTNALLQYCGYSCKESKAAIKLMRDVTAREAVSKHWDWAAKVMAYEKEITGL